MAKAQSLEAIAEDAVATAARLLEAHEAEIWLRRGDAFECAERLGPGRARRMDEKRATRLLEVLEPLAYFGIGELAPFEATLEVELVGLWVDRPTLSELRTHLGRELNLDFLRDVPRHLALKREDIAKKLDAYGPPLPSLQGCRSLADCKAVGWKRAD